MVDLVFILFIDETMKDELAGTTAITVLLKNHRLYCVSIISYGQTNCRFISKILKVDLDDFEYLVWLESLFQALSIDTTYTVLECL